LTLKQNFGGSLGDFKEEITTDVIARAQPSRKKGERIVTGIEGEKASASE